MTLRVSSYDCVLVLVEATLRMGLGLSGGVFVKSLCFLKTYACTKSHPQTTLANVVHGHEDSGCNKYTHALTQTHSRKEGVMC